MFLGTFIKVKEPEKEIKPVASKIPKSNLSSTKSKATTTKAVKTKLMEGINNKRKITSNKSQQNEEIKENIKKYFTGTGTFNYMI